MQGLPNPQMFRALNDNAFDALRNAYLADVALVFGELDDIVNPPAGEVYSAENALQHIRNVLKGFDKRETERCKNARKVWDDSLEGQATARID